jgi:hypothetical protein
VDKKEPYVATGDVLYSGLHNIVSGGSSSGSWWVRFGNADPSNVAQFILGHARDDGGWQDIPSMQWGQTYQIQVLEGAADSVPGAIHQHTLDVGEATLKVAAGEIAAASTTFSVPAYDSYGADTPPVTIPSLVLAGQVTPVPSQVTVVILPAA